MDLSGSSCRHRLAPAFVLALLSLPVTAAPLEPGDRQKGNVVPFSLHGHLVVVKGAIGDQKDLSLVIDTGASRSVIDSKLAEKMNLVRQTKTVTVYGSPRSFEIVTVPSIALAGRFFPEVSVAVADLSLPDRDEVVAFDGLIGLDVLRQTSISIDFEARTVEVGGCVHSGVSCAYYDKLPFVPVILDVGGERVILSLDTGAAHLILYQNRAEGRILVKETGEKREIETLDGKLKLRCAEMQDIRLEETHFESLPAFLLDRRVSEGEPDGVLGVAALGLKRLTLSGGVMSWER
jgi:predicted aspartyl protease